MVCRQNHLQKKPKYLAPFWAMLKRVTFKVNIVLATFATTFGKSFMLFSITSGHTGHSGLYESNEKMKFVQQEVSVKTLKIFKASTKT